MQTSTTLLRSLQANRLGRAWFRMVDVYGPMVRGWLRRHGVSRQDADDVVQEVLLVVVTKLPAFRRQRLGSFRNWLRRITVNCMRDHCRRTWRHISPPGGDETLSMLNQLADGSSELARRWNEEHDRHVFQFAARQVQTEFSRQSWAAFHRTALEGESAGAVADQLGMSVNAVCIAKSRVRARLAEVARELLA